MTIKEARDGLIARLDTIDGLRVSARVPETINPPAAAVRLGPTEYDQAMAGGLDEVAFIVSVFTSMSSDRGEDSLYDYVNRSGDKSIKAAVEADVTLGDTARFSHVTKAGEMYVTTTKDGVRLYTIDLTVRVGI